ncbi:cystathionine beta-lyase [Sphingomonas xanthus]|uniref:Cystathionine beta-lyase n=1 Tax=Sphingomonas xanthus TaxID=2594473 RepID=A0A516INR2_9SPHN|nr:cystathionine beta-lyase [Sphingomonas xanthus]QDP18507.1 cystathionine beta-lyase [Sphingomonas xanthus]
MEEGPNRKRLATRLIHPDRQASTDFRSLAAPTYRGSTIAFDSVADILDVNDVNQYRYGLYGTPTTRELALQIGAIEGAEHCLILPSGLSAITLVYLALCRAGDHVLVTESAYGPNTELAFVMLRGFGIEVERYNPLVGAGISELIRDNTRLIWTESPGSITMEVQDIAAICAAAKARGVTVAIDNSYGAGLLFDAFGAGADISIQALTKYAGGHSDLLLGSVSTNDDRLDRKLRLAQRLTGMGVSPDDCSAVLRGLKTLDVRLRHFEQSTMTVARWLDQRDEVTALLHPAFSDCPGHEIWKRDWSGSAGLFSIIFGNWTRRQVETFVDSLQLFTIGYSWGGAHSIAICYSDLKRPTPELGPLLVRLNIGLEDPADLIDDLDQALAKAASA